MSFSLSSKLLELARASGCADVEKAEAALATAAEGRGSLVRGLLESGTVEEAAFAERLAGWLGLPFLGTGPEGVAAPLRERLPARLAFRHHLLPLTEEEDGTVRMACYDPFNLVARQVAGMELGGPVRWEVAPRAVVLDGLRQGYGVGAETFDLLMEGREAEDMASEMRQETNVLDGEDDEASVIRFVNQIFREALEQRATDIHLEPVEDDLRIRYRVDGVLSEVPAPTQIRALRHSVVARLKIMAHLDIAERRLPQDGRINLELGGVAIDVRVATIPSVTGESVSLRLLGRESFTLDKLGLSEEARVKIEELLRMPNGIVLVTGPTGSGKSTTLYTLLSQLNTVERRIVTIEDPVEYKLPGVVQIAVKPEIDLTFAKGLRSILRGDPNVIMVGEMRDFETAEIAIRAALTGHLVFSTLHTNDSLGGVTRLLDMGVEPFLLSSSVRAFLAQRLVRTLCPHCSQPAGAHYSQTYLRTIGFPVAEAGRIKIAKGCPKCRQTGYQGRTALYEICPVSQRMQDMITRNSPMASIRQVAVEEGFAPLRQDGWRKVAGGLTTIEEILRVTAAEEERGEK